MAIPEGIGQKHTSEAAGKKDLFFGTLDDLGQHEAQAQDYSNLVKDTENIRLIVLETWLFVDYSVRCLLMSGLALDRFDHADLDLRYTLLPHSLVACLSLLRKLRRVNEGLPAAPEEPFRARIRKWEQFDRFEPGLSKRIGAAEESYRHTFELGPCRSGGGRRCYRSVPEGWIEVAARVDESWVKRANQLNTARNLAAHCHDESRIAAKLGFLGPNALTQVREACIRLANDLAGLRAFLDTRFTPTEAGPAT